MLIRSQNKVQLIPVGEFAFSVMLNGSISANKNIFATVHEATQSIVGRYSTREKAIKVLDMICDAYEGINTKKRTMKVLMIMSRCSRCQKMMR